MNPDVGRVIASLLRVAKYDLDDARQLATTGSRNAIYLCEQAVEKVIRAILTSEGARAGIGHELERMVDLIPDANPLKPDLRAVAHLGRYATSYRYPTAAGRIVATPSPALMAEELAKAEALLFDVAARFGVDFAQDVPARDIGPFR